ncbi:MAG: hypothetical protein MI784_02300 [Cytophagales bacterium]|nr:hypothetical protein [Cytophagales bacterium]
MLKGLNKIGWFFFLCLLSGCLSDEYRDADNLSNVQINPAFALNIGQVSYTLEDLMEETDGEFELLTDESGLYKVKYSLDVVDFNLERVFELEDQRFTRNLGLSFPPLPSLPPGLLPDTIVLDNLMNERIQFDWESDDRIDSLVFRSGALAVQLVLPLMTDYVAEVRFPNLMDASGNPYRHISRGTNGNTISFSVNLSDYKLSMEDNRLDFEVLLNELRVPLANYPSSDGSIGINVTFRNAGLDVVYGQFNRREFDFSNETIELGMFENDIAGDVFFADPNLMFRVTHNFGLSMAMNFTEILGTNQEREQFRMNGTIMESPQTMASAITPGSPVTDTLFVNRANSNLPDFLSSLPHSIQFDSHVEVGGPSAREQFLTHDASADVALDVVLPFEFWARELEYSDLSDTDPIDDDIDDILEQGLVKLVVDNAIPMGMHLQVYILDRNRRVLDSLFESPEAILFAPAELDASNHSIPVRTQTAIVLDSALMNQLKRMEYYEVKVAVATTQAHTQSPPSVRLRRTDSISVRLGVQAVLDLSTDD